MDLYRGGSWSEYELAKCRVLSAYSMYSIGDVKRAYCSCSRRFDMTERALQMGAALNSLDDGIVAARKEAGIPLQEYKVLVKALRKIKAIGKEPLDDEDATADGFALKDAGRMYSIAERALRAIKY